SQPNSAAYTSPWAITTQPRSPGRPSRRISIRGPLMAPPRSPPYPNLSPPRGGPPQQPFQWQSSTLTHTAPPPPPRRKELLERAYLYALGHGLADLSLRPLAAAIGTSPRVLLFLFGSKDGLIRALLARARADELAFLEQARAAGQADLAAMVR